MNPLEIIKIEKTPGNFILVVCHTVSEVNQVLLKARAHGYNPSVLDYQGVINASEFLKLSS